MSEEQNTPGESKAKNLLKKGGILVFLFFLLKGIGWLVLLGLVFFGLMNEAAVQRFKDLVPFL